MTEQEKPKPIQMVALAGVFAIAAVFAWPLYIRWMDATTPHYEAGTYLHDVLMCLNAAGLFGGLIALLALTVAPFFALAEAVNLAGEKS